MRLSGRGEESSLTLPIYMKHCNHLNSPCYFFLPTTKDIMCKQMFFVEVFIGGGRDPGTNEYT